MKQQQPKKMRRKMATIKRKSIQPFVKWFLGKLWKRKSHKFINILIRIFFLCVFFLWRKHKSNNNMLLVWIFQRSQWSDRIFHSNRPFCEKRKEINQLWFNFWSIWFPTLASRTLTEWKPKIPIGQHVPQVQRVKCQIVWWNKYICM